MSIKKCIMNYFDKATNAMIPFHPQTESAAITDWHESIIRSLASKVLPTVVSELTTDSVMGKLMKLLLNASGVKYNIAQNGYVCLGSFFGGLIIQWGIMQLKNGKGTISLPISAEILFCVLQHYGISPQYYGCNDKSVVGSLKEDDTARWTALCK